MAALAGSASLAAEGASKSLRPITTESITVGEQITFRSEILDAEVTMNIALPESFEISSVEHTYPVLFVSGSHGREFFSTVSGIAKHLGDRERIPELIVVSLNDLGGTPDVHTHGMWGREILDGSDADAAKQLQHIAQEIVPYLRESYRANDYRILVGVSRSALLPIYALTEAPELFESYVLVAAADVIGMGYAEDETFIDAIEATVDKQPQIVPKLYLGTADRDLEKRPEYRENLKELRSRLGTSDRIDMRIEEIHDDDHYAALIPAMLSALEQNFPDERWAARYRDLVAQPGDALANIDRYYEALSKEYGFEILPRADRWNNVNCLRFMIRHLIGANRAGEAVRIAERRVKYRPRSSNSYSGLADALEAADRPEDAIAALETAIQLEAEAEAAIALRARIRGLSEGKETTAQSQTSAPAP